MTAPKYKRFTCGPTTADRVLARWRARQTAKCTQERLYLRLPPPTGNEFALGSFGLIDLDAASDRTQELLDISQRPQTPCPIGNAY